MILTINVGHTNVTFGVFDGDKAAFFDHIPTNNKKTDFEYSADFYRSFTAHSVPPESITDCAIASAVPRITLVIAGAVKRIIHRVPLILTSKKYPHFPLCIDEPESLSGNLLADYLAVINTYPLPAIFVDMATATTIGVISENKEYLGTSILPGMQSSFNELGSGAAMISVFRVVGSDHLVGKNTFDSIQGAAVYGTAEMIDGILSRIEDELHTVYHLAKDKTITYILTGRSSHLILPHLSHPVIHNDGLALRGLLSFIEDVREGGRAL